MRESADAIDTNFTDLVNWTAGKLSAWIADTECAPIQRRWLLEAYHLNVICAVRDRTALLQLEALTSIEKQACNMLLGTTFAACLSAGIRAVDGVAKGCHVIILELAFKFGKDGKWSCNSFCEFHGYGKGVYRTNQSHCSFSQGYPGGGMK